MNPRCRKGVVFAALGAVLTTGACGDRAMTSPSGTNVPVVFVSAEPSTIAPQFLPGSHCGLPAFRAHLRLGLRPGRDVRLKGFRFDFADRLGVRTSPLVVPTSFGTSSTLPVSGPITFPTSSSLPTTSPVAVPGFAAIDESLAVDGVFRTFGFALEFGCGILADGTIFIGVDTVDGHGRPYTSRLEVPLRD